MIDSGSSEKGNTESLSSVLARDSRLARELKSRLSALGSSRSSLIRQLREISPKFKSVILKVRELRAARDKHTALVKELKAKREEANKSLKGISEELGKAAEAEREAISRLSHGKGIAAKKKSASQLVAEIAALELKIETEVMPFE